MKRRLVLSLILTYWVLPCAATETHPPQGNALTLLRVVGDFNYPPYLFLDPDGRTVGYVADLWQLWSAKTGIAVQLLASEWAEAQRRLLAGEADVIDNLFYTPARAPLYDFGPAYATLPVAIYVHASISGIDAPAALRGFRVGVMAGDACIEMLRQQGITDLAFYPDYTALIKAALAEEIKLFCLDEYPANYYLYRLGAQHLFRKAFKLYEGQFHRAVRKGNTELLALVERGMARITPAEYRALERKWFGQPLAIASYLRTLSWAVGAFLLAGILLLLWNHLLRRQVAVNTAQLRTALAELGAARAALEDQVAQRTAALSAALAQQAALFDALDAGIVLLRERIIVRGNRMLDEMFGYAPGEQCGQSTRPWYPDQATYERVGAEICANLDQTGVDRAERLLVRKDGTRFWARMSGRLIDPTDPTQGMVIVVQDVTREHETLEQLRQAQAQAEESTRLKAAFIANMSHEIRTPLNAILGLTELLRKTVTSERQQDYTLRLHAAAGQLLALIDDILDFARLDSGSFRLDTTPFVVAATLERALTPWAERATAKGLAFTWHLAPDVPPYLIGDPVRLAQMFIHYVSNALKFTERGKIAVTVEIIARTADTVTLRGIVRDTGCGIAPQQQRVLFQSFRPGDDSPGRHHGGTGLGLALVQRLAAAMAGEVGCESLPGAGATFWFTARLGIDAHASAAASLPPPSVASPPVPQPSPDTAALYPLRRSPEAKALCARLARQLAQDDFASLQTLDDHAEVLRAALGTSFTAIAAAIRAFRFAEAHNLLIPLLKEPTS